MDFTSPFQKLPNGPAWVEGKMLKQLGAMLNADRARLATTSGSEVPTSQGRFFIINGGTGTATATADTTWNVYTRNVSTTETPVWERGVSVDSPLIKSQSHTDITYPASGTLDSADLTTASGWVATDFGDFIWAEVEFDYTDTENPFTVGGFNVLSTSAGSVFHGEAIYVNSGSDDDPIYNLWKLNIPVATIGADSTGKLVATKRYLRDIPWLVARFVTAVDADGAEPVDIQGMWWQA